MTPTVAASDFTWGLRHSTATFQEAGTAATLTPSHSLVDSLEAETEMASRSFCPVTCRVSPISATVEVWLMVSRRSAP